MRLSCPSCNSCSEPNRCLLVRHSARCGVTWRRHESLGIQAGCRPFLQHFCSSGNGGPQWGWHLQRQPEQQGAHRLPRFSALRLGTGHPGPQQVRGRRVPAASPLAAAHRGYRHLTPMPAPSCRRIIKEIKVNHEAQTPEALARNCLLIRELNTNMAAVRPARRCALSRPLCHARCLSFARFLPEASDPQLLLRSVLCRSCAPMAA